MQYARRLYAVWTWLPAFRAVAETQHLPTAARELGVVPSALSRAVRLLEDELGTALFDRVGHQLVLNHEGRALLSVVRDAMRQLDEGIEASRRDEPGGVLCAAACADLASLILSPCVGRLAAAHASLRVVVMAVDEADVQAQLLKGDADVAVVCSVPVHDDLVVERIGELGRAVYVAAGETAQLAGPVRMTVVGARGELPEDGWPPQLARSTVSWAPDERAALDIARAGPLATVAYDLLADLHVRAGALRRVDAPAIPARPLYVVYRRPVVRHHRVEDLVALIRDAAVELGG